MKRLKGPTRPVQNETARATVMASLAPVDLVVLFDGKDVAEVVRAIRPNLQVKGTDYTPETVPERELVESFGGRVVIAGDPKDHSSSSLRAKLRGR